MVGWPLPPQEIDELNISQATMVAMQASYRRLSVQPDMALIDGNRVPEITYRCYLAIVKGDSAAAEISAASIIAKSSS